MLCSICKYPCRTTVQQSPSAGMLDKDKAELLPVQKMNSTNLSLEMLQAVHLTHVQGTLDAQLSTNLAWRKLVAAHLLYIPFCSYILPPLCYSAGQAKKVWMCNRSYWTSVLQNQRTRKENLKKMPNYISTWISALIRSRNNPYSFPSTAFKHSKHKLPVCCLESPGIKFIL